MAETGLITLSRTIAASPKHLFSVLTSPEARQIWGPPDPQSVVLIENQPAPAPGVRELSRVGPAENPYVDVTTDWIRIDEAERLVYSEMLEAEGTALGISFATLELTETDAGTDLNVTVQIVSFVGDEIMSEMESGWTHAFESMAKYAEQG